MIDFRYHLVSLISVFLALAVGIALGAGPLKESIGDTLTGQVDQLRLEKDELRAESEALAGHLADAEDVLTALAPSVLDGTLGERRVAIVVLDEVAAAVVEQVGRSVTQAGGSVTAVATLTDSWTDPARSAFRQSLAATMVGYLSSVPTEDAGTQVELAEALAQGLTMADPVEPDVLSEHAQVLLDLFGGDSGLVTFDHSVDAPADAIIVLAGPIADEPVDDTATDDTATDDTATDDTATDDTATDDVATGTPDEQTPAEQTSEATSEDEAAIAARIDAWVQVALAAQRRSAGAVVATAAVSEPGLVHTIRTTDLSAELSTVDDVRSPAGVIAVPLAVAHRISGVVGQFGSGPDATDPVPARISLPTIERFAVEPQVGGPDGEAETPETETPETEASDAETEQG